MMHGNLTIKEAVKLSGRSEWFLRNRVCAWCGASLLTTLRMGCQSMYDAPSCDPTKKDFSKRAEFTGKPPICESCGKNPADFPSRICVGCDAYREHQR